jgi:hypothetical protein
MCAHKDIVPANCKQDDPDDDNDFNPYVREQSGALL